MNDTQDLAKAGLSKWIALHVIGSLIAVLGALYLLANMTLIPGVPGSPFQALAMLAGGLILDFWGVVGLTRILRARKAAKAAKA
ncbi:hypothetical protein G3580_15560 [Nitrogeniibacter mangrovi]|uniref:Transmembrane protein n=1 Tax=Nitrogeniibacter mangrovi TaxID=2016596 RepID=A0A6C1B5D2_9RHOO|nr:hypothetical protein [Nitrogeniibacter mangrovi]QID18912.1 hypothetical protein G3580_15560 [Nitrogeniibacter mangrovi]